MDRDGPKSRHVSRPLANRRPPETLVDLDDCSDTETDNANSRDALVIGHQSRPKLLLRESGDLPTPNQRDSNGGTPLHVADRTGCPVKEDGCTPLHVACRNGHLNTVRRLLCVDKSCTPNCRDKNGRTPLLTACVGGHLDIVRYLIIAHGCDTATPDRNGCASLHLACMEGHLDVVKFLLNSKHCDPKCRTKLGKTALELACDFKHTEVANYLTQESARVKTGTCDIEHTLPANRDTGYVTGEHLCTLDTLEPDDELSCSGSTSLGPSTGFLDRPTKKRRLEQYSERLRSFLQDPQPWSRPHPSAERLAEVGFFYLGYEGAVECHICGAVITNWEGDSDPLFRHYSKNPNCPFLSQNFASEVRKLTSSQAAQNYTEKFANSSARLHSFTHWPLGAQITSYQLASVGFYYTGTGTRVRCFSCGLTYDDWRSGDVPLLIHRKRSPLCRYLNALLNTGPSVPIPLPLALPSELPPQHPLKPDWANEHARLKSFKYLPETVPVSREDCARAGLYFLRKPDVMKCFSCEAVVKEWVPGDVPEEKHREVNPECKFLREFFPSKLEQRTSESSEEGIDPSTLPEPQYSEADLEMLSKQFGYETEFSRLSLGDRPPLSQYHGTYPPSEYSTDTRPPQPHYPPSEYSTDTRPPQPYYQYDSSYHTGDSTGKSSLQSSYSTNQKVVDPYDSAFSHQPPSSYDPHYSSAYLVSSNRERSSAPHQRQDVPSSSNVQLSQVSPQSFPSGSSNRSTMASSIMDKPILLPPSYVSGAVRYQSSHGQSPYGTKDTPHMAAPHTGPPLSLDSEDGRLCVICMDAPLEVTFIPCGHVCACERCSQEVRHCPMCRRPKRGTMKVFLPY